MKDIFLIVSSLLAFAAYITYISAILKKEARSHRTTRLVTFIIAALATASLFVDGQKLTFYVWLLR